MKGSNIVSFVIGAVISGGVTWFATNSHYKKLRDEEAADFRAKIKELNESLKESKKEESAEDPQEVKKRNDEMVDSILEGAKKIAESHQYTNYSDADAKKEDETSEIKGSEDGSTHMRKDVVKISEKEYYDPENPYDANGITLYMDAVFCDDAGKVMSNAYLAETIGLDIRDELVETENLDTVYVRNNKTHKDYEVICSVMSYEDAQRKEHE